MGGRGHHRRDPPAGSLLEDAGWAGQDIHFIVIDTEGAERDVLETIDLHRWRPWVLVVEATRRTAPSRPTRDWEHLVLGAGYRFCLFDGLSRFYVAEEKADELGPLLQTPANILDNYITHRQAVLSAELDAVRADMIRHDEMNQSAILELAHRGHPDLGVTPPDGRRTPEREEELLHQIHLHVNHIQFVDEQLETERAVNDALRRTLSWRVTRPLRRAARHPVGRQEGRFLSEPTGASSVRRHVGRGWPRTGHGRLVSAPGRGAPARRAPRPRPP